MKLRKIKLSDLIYFEIFYYIFSSVITNTFHVTRTIMYIGDVINILVFVLAIIKNKNSINPKKFKGIYLIFILILGLGVFNALLNYESMFLIFWGLKNSIRFFTFFYSCVIFLDIESFEVMKKIVNILFYISIPLAFVQRFLISYPTGTILGDMIGGIFGNYSGCNTPLNVVLVLYTLNQCSSYFSGKMNIGKFIISCALCIFITALAELKIYFIEFLIIFILYAIFTKKKLTKKIIGIMILCLFFSVCVTFVVNLNGESSDYSEIFTIDGFIDYATRDSGYNGSGDINRLTGVSIVSQKIFGNNLYNKIFGIGLGNAEYTSYTSSSFYRSYGNINYQFFHSVWLFIENGYVGLILYLSILVIMYFKCKRLDEEIKKYVKISIILMLVLFTYNTSLRAETTGFMLYYILSIPFLVNKKKKEETN